MLSLHLYLVSIAVVPKYGHLVQEVCVLQIVICGLALQHQQLVVCLVSFAALARAQVHKVECL